MFGKLPLRNNRKLRASNWFARERDGDMQAFDIPGLAAGIRAYVEALIRDRVARRSSRTTPPD